MSFKRGQVGIFVVVALIIVVGIGLFFVISKVGSKNSGNIEIEKAFARYSECLTRETKLGSSIAGSQGGYIYTEDYKEGSALSPTGGELKFLGSPVVYWNYVSANGIDVENKPSKQKIETEIGRFLEEKLKDCNFDDFYQLGMEIVFEESGFDIKISESQIEVGAKTKMSVHYENQTSVKDGFNVKVGSKIGKFYRIASDIYNKSL